MTEDAKNPLLNANELFIGLGKILSLMSTHSSYQDKPLKEMMMAIYPAIISNQFIIGHNNFLLPPEVMGQTNENMLETPTSFFTWACVDDDFHKKLLAPPTQYKVPFEKYTSGKNLWILEAIGTDKEIKILEKFVKKKMNYDESSPFHRVSYTL